MECSNEWESRGHVYFGWKVKVVSCVQLFETPWTVVHGILQARILDWVAFPFSRGSSQPKDQTQVSRIVGGLFTRGATREAQYLPWMEGQAC